ncbi:GIY-YIG nuclease family protein [Bacillus sp. HMF5848]|uniref:GIY-YIG nuclease family protein n=1 Tax=Bacillus sp. HMF5848 TaxID=2495421 RepID=UPI000F78D14B|nr:GIY-YIG nuclease family protein [Bacillus sp. HMF5848]RSK27306.1 GIY-YIG nuclease family protein [Bacillus sp. HMF5848]
MIESINETHTIYAVYIHINKDMKIVVGKLGECFFKKGTYIYVGSAKRNIKARINRHIMQDKKLRWHIDYLRKYGSINKIVTYDSSLSECERCIQILEKYKGELPIKGFGSSDCKCNSHLIFIPNV